MLTSSRCHVGCWGLRSPVGSAAASALSILPPPFGSLVQDTFLVLLLWFFTRALPESSGKGGGKGERERLCHGQQQPSILSEQMALEENSGWLLSCWSTAKILLREAATRCQGASAPRSGPSAMERNGFLCYFKSEIPPCPLSGTGNWTVIRLQGGYSVVFEGKI